MLEALKIKKDGMPRPRDDQVQLLSKTWDCTIDRAQFFSRASKQTTHALSAFTKDLLWKGIEGETDLWREMNFATSAELYEDGPPQCESFVFCPRHYVN